MIHFYSSAHIFYTFFAIIDMYTCFVYFRINYSNAISFRIFLSTRVLPFFFSTYYMHTCFLTDSGINGIEFASFKLYHRDCLYCDFTIYMTKPLYLSTCYNIAYHIFLTTYIRPTLHVHMPIFRGIFICLMLQLLPVTHIT